ncbi:MAG: WD40 repeat domain-containing protein [Thermotogota bacterium]
MRTSKGVSRLALGVSLLAAGCWGGLTPPCMGAESLFAFQRITIENAGRVRLLRKLEIPDYQRGALSQCSVAFSPDGRLLVAASGKNPVPIWDVQSGSVVRRLYEGAPTQIVACAFSPDGATLACGGFDKAISLWSLATSERLASWPAHSTPVWELAWSSDGAILASCGLSSDIRLWNVLTGDQVWSYAGAHGYLSVAFNPAGGVLAYGGRRDGAGTLDVETGKPVTKLSQPQNPVGDVAYSPLGDLLAAGTDDNVIYVWNATDYSLVASLAGHSDYVNGIVFSPDGTLLASGSHDKTIGIWDVAGQRRLATLEGHTAEVLRVAFSPDETLIASTSWDGTVCLWGVPSD